jgi:S1-C subfamily serine protease
LLDASGAVVGINTAMIPYARGIGFAIPAHAASWIVAVLLQKGRIDRPFLGIAASGVDLLPALANETGQARAVRVHEVSACSPAEAAGVTRGDLLLCANGAPLASVDDLQRVLVLAEPQKVQIELIRGGRRHALEATPRREPKAA